MASSALLQRVPGEALSGMASAGPSDASKYLGISSEFDFLRGLLSLLSGAEVHGLSTTKALGLIKTHEALRSHASAWNFL